MFNTISASENIKNAYIDYIATTFHFADKRYDDLFRTALSADGAVAKGPFLDVSGSYETGKSLRELIADGVVSPLFGELESCPESDKELPVERPLYLHQQKAVERAAMGSNLVVTTGTGSGKTECFLIPVINELLREKESGTLQNHGMRTLIVYPMNALANDQLKRLRGILSGYPEITFGVYNGSTEEKDSSGKAKYQSTFGKAPLPNEILSREKMRTTPPHILITNYSMLEHTLLRPEDDYIFSGADLRYIVLDEAHIYKGATGIETALLMRRLCARLSATDKVRYILTSATLGGKDSDNDIIGFMKHLCGADMSTKDIIRSSEKCPAIKEKREFPSELFSDIINNEEKISEILAKYNADFAPDGGVSEKLFELCLHSALFEQFRTKTEEPITFKELHDSVSCTRAITEEQLRDFIEVCAKAVKNHTALIKPRYHYFLRAIDGAFVTLDEPKQLFLDRKEKDEATGQCIFEAGVCETCGRLSVLGSIHNGYLNQNSDGAYKAYTPRRADELFDDNEINEETGCGERDYVLCPKCGAVSSVTDIKFGERLCECGSKYIHITESDVTKDERKLKCPACEFGIITPIVNGANAATSVLATELYEQLPDKKTVSKKSAPVEEDDLFGGLEESVREKSEELTRQFLCFSDTRSGAAYFAPYLENSYAEILRRRSVWQAADIFIEDGKTEVSVPEFVEEIKQIFSRMGTFDKDRINANAWIAVVNEMLRMNTSTGLVAMGKIAFSYNNIMHNGLANNFAKRSQGALTAEEVHSVLDLLVMDVVLNGSVDCGRKYSWLPEDMEYLFRTSFPKYTIKQGEKNGKKYSWLPRNKAFSNNRLIRVKKYLPGMNTDEAAAKFLGDYWDKILSDQIVKSQDGLLLNACDFNISFGNTKFYKCSKCGKVTPYNIHNDCPNLRCDGTLTEFDPSALANNHYAGLYRSSHMKQLKIREHTAQLDKETASRYQEQFKNKQLNALSCSTTFEMGVDLGSLETVFMRDVPPSPANYVQRAGRAGRSLESSAFVLTFAKRSSHDYTFYSDPIKMISGRINVPKFEIANRKIAARHIYAIAFAGFFKLNNDVYHKGLDFFLDSGYKRFCDYLNARPAELMHALLAGIPKVLHTEMGISDYSWTNDLIGSDGVLTLAIDDLKSDLKRIDEIADEAAQTRDFDNASDISRYRNTLLNPAGHSNALIEFLVRHNILPKYGFLVDVVKLNTNTLSCKEGRALDLNRDLQLAIADYSPDSEVVANGNTYISRYIRKMPDNKGGWEFGFTAVCAACNEISFTKTPIDSEGRKCTHCGEIIPLTGWKQTLEPRLGFAAEFRPSVKMTPPSHGQKSSDYYIGDGSGRIIGKTAFEIGGSKIVMESTANDSLVVLSAGSYYVCPSCGWASQNMPPKTHKNVFGRTCNASGKKKEYYLSHDFKTDVVKLTFDDDSAQNGDIMQSVLYAMLEGISDELGIERTDIKGCTFMSPYNGRWIHSLIIYDAAAGGAGHVRRLLTSDGMTLHNVIVAALKRVENCTCDTSCYFCLRNYYNQKIHDKLNRHSAADFLRRWTCIPSPIEIDEPEAFVESASDISEINEQSDTAEKNEFKVSLSWQDELRFMSPSAVDFLGSITSSDELYPGRDNIGADIADADGRVICSAEAWWSDSRNIVLLDALNADKKGQLTALGYKVFVAGTDSREEFEQSLRKDTVTI